MKKAGSFSKLLAFLLAEKEVGMALVEGTGGGSGSTKKKRPSNSWYLNQGTLGKVDPGSYYNSSGGSGSNGQGGGSGGSSGGGSGGSSGGGTTTGSGYNSTSYAAELERIRAEQQAAAEAYQAQLRAEAQAAYDRNMGALNDSFNNKMNALKDNYNSTVASLGDQYDYSKGEVNTDADRALREAYVNRMLSQRNLQQQLTAQGLSGGASETTMAGLRNNYGNARNNIETNRNDNLASLNNLYQTNLADALSQYNLQRANAEDLRTQLRMQIESDLANTITGSYGSQISALGNLDDAYYQTLMGLLDKQAEYDYNASVAGNTPRSVTSYAQNNMTSGTNYAREQALENARVLQQNGATQQQIVQQLGQAGVNNQAIYDILGQLYGG